MGEVYLIENLRRGRLEALKVLRTDAASTGMHADRMQREASAMNRLEHENIARVYDSGILHEDSRFYIAMEYVEGTLLEQSLAGGRLAVPRALSILAQLAAATDHAHQRGVVHRDLTPRNTMLTDHGGRELVKVLDFGLAKLMSPDDGPAPIESGRFGTPAYMAPERAVRGRSDPRSDIYSLGCIAFHMLVGRPPFVGQMLEIMDAHERHRPEPPSIACEDPLPEVLDDIVLRCLEKDPARRFPTAAAIQDAIARLPFVRFEEARR